MKIHLAALYTCLISACLAKDNVVTTSDGALQLSVLRLTTIPIKKGGTKEKPPRFDVGFEVFLTNRSKEEITVPTYLGEDRARVRARVRSGDSWEEKIDYWFMLHRGEAGEVYVMSPVFYRFVTLKPGESAHLPAFGAAIDDETDLPAYVFRYVVETEFADRYNCWTGRLTVTSEMKKETARP